MHLRADERTERCGRVPAHVVARLKKDPGLVAFRGDPDRLVMPGRAAGVALAPLPVPASALAHLRKVDSVLEQVARQAGATGVRLRAAAARFRADYHLAASPGRLRTDTPAALMAARARLAEIETALGAGPAGLAEMLVLDGMTLPALRHVTGQGLADARPVLVRLAVAYGLATPDQDAGKAFASD